jgi:N-acetylmuramoyl-L-alanine amidase
MSSRAMTRRSLLAATAGAAAASVMRPGSVLAALALPPRPTLEERWVGRLSGETLTVALAGVADLVGVQWQAPAGASIHLRFRDASGRWSGWASAADRGHRPEHPPRAGALIGEPLWTGGTTLVQLRADAPVSGVRLHLVDVSGGTGASSLARFGGPLASAAELELATPVLAAGAGQPPIIARRAWAQGISPPRVAPGYGAVRMAFVHHTDNPNGYAPEEVPAMLRAIYTFHRYVNGWNDIGYNFVVDLYGRMFEARAGGIDEPVVGAHAGGYNLFSTGVAVMGTFTGVPISLAARGALERLLAWKLALHGLPAEGSVAVRVNAAGAVYSRFPANSLVSLARIAGHRDGDTTDCPGDALYGELPGIRRGVQALAPQPTRATLALNAPPSTAPAPASQPPPVTPGQAPAGEAPTLLGSLHLLDGTPIVGATVLLQARVVSRKGEIVQERTIAEAVTDAQGSWSLPHTFSSARGGFVSLRALYAGSSGSGASVSEPLQVPVTTPAGVPPAPAPTAPAA